jgi:hypothetical protein
MPEQIQNTKLIPKKNRSSLFTIAAKLANYKINEIINSRKEGIKNQIQILLPKRSQEEINFLATQFVEFPSPNLANLSDEKIIHAISKLNSFILAGILANRNNPLKLQESLENSINLIIQN